MTDRFEIRFPRILIAVVVSLAAACGGGSGGNNGGGNTGGGGSTTISSITITPADPSVVADSSTQLVATATYSNGSTEDVTSSGVWSTVVPQIATVSNTGVLTGGSVGKSYVEVIVSGKNSFTEATVTSAHTLTVLHQFTGDPDGGQPSSLMQASDGNFYGVTDNSSPTGIGTVYRLSPP